MARHPLSTSPPPSSFPTSLLPPSLSSQFGGNRSSGKTSYTESCWAIYVCSYLGKIFSCAVGGSIFLIETSKFTKLHHPLFEQPEKSIGIFFKHSLVKQHETTNKCHSVWGMYLLDVTPSNPIITSTHSTLWYSGWRVWLLSNIQQCIL